MITAVIQIGRQATAIELPQDRFSLRYWLAQLGIRERPENIPISNGMEKGIGTGGRSMMPCLFRTTDFPRRMSRSP